MEKDMGIKAVLLAKPDHLLNQPGETEVFPEHTVGSLTEFEELLLAGKI